MDKLIGLVVAMTLVVGVIYLILIILAASAILLMIGLGLFSFYIVKSRRAIVQETDVSSAVVLSMTWAGALTVGMIIGSVGLSIALEYALKPHQIAAMQQRYGDPTGFSSAALFLQNWIIADAYLFFIKTSLLIYMTNRVFLRRQLKDGHALLSVLPPMFGFAIFFLSSNWQAFVALLYGGLASLSTIALAFLQVIRQPFLILWELANNPNSVLSWAGQKLVESDGSLFRLAKILPEIFVVLIILFFVRAITTSNEGASGEV